MEENFNNLFNFKIIYSKNRKRSIGLKIINGILEIRSPRNIKKDFILTLIEKRKNWILERINSKTKEKIELINNNKIKFLGKEVNLAIKENHLLKNGGYCELLDEHLTINISKDYSKTLLENIVKKWYKDECLKLMLQRVKEYSQKYNLKYNNITIKEQKSVWGTCSIKNDLTFNWKIILFDIDVIDYLIIHELTHTVYKNHSKLYWNAVARIIPNHKELRKKLRNNNQN